MYKVEYLLLAEDDKAKCKTVKSLKSLLESDSDIEIEKNKVFYKGYTALITIKPGKKDSDSHLFFNITLQCETEKDIDKFSELLRAIRGSVSLISKTNYVIWDDLSLFFAQQAYPIIFRIENLMRQLITKFMLTNIGIGWTKDRVPTDVQQSINPNNKDINYLNNVDFIQLKTFLFSENYPTHKDSLIQKLKNAKDLSNLNLEDIKSLLPESNWNKYFQPLVGCDAEYLKKRWDKLYDLRCNVAHNKPFTKLDLDNVKTLAFELEPHLIKGLESLDEIVITENERESLAENVVINFSEAFGDFIINYRHLEKLLYLMSNHQKNNPDGKKVIGFANQSGLLLDKGIINNQQYADIKLIFYVRNRIVHHSDLSVTIKEINHCGVLIEELIQFFKQYF